MKDNKFILDACCGGRHFWFNKNNPNVLFMDIRKEPKGFIPQQKNFEIEPDIIGDFRKTDFRDKQFKHIVLDIPHKVKKDNGLITKKYGYLGDNWEEDLRKGFNEMWRILDDFGTLNLKFTDLDISTGKLLSLFPVQALYGIITKKGANNTYWFNFMKIPEADLQEKK